MDRDGKEDENGDNVFYFHGTNHHFALDILNSGLDITMSDQYSDFSIGHGFYFTDEPLQAFESVNLHTDKPAILVFTLNTKMMIEKNMVILFSEKKLWK